MKFNYEKFAEAINRRMFAEMAKQKNKLGLRYFARIIKTSPSTLSRALNGKTLDVDTILAICVWLNVPIMCFVD